MYKRQGSIVGSGVGSEVGEDVPIEGDRVGLEEASGELVGRSEGGSVGLFVGESVRGVGDRDGDGVMGRIRHTSVLEFHMQEGIRPQFRMQ